jgi:hypothetical protein
MTGVGSCDYIDADLRGPDVIMREAARTLDLTLPVAVLVAILHFIPDTDDPQGIVTALAAGLAPGSFVAISHLSSDLAPVQVTSGVPAYNMLIPARITARTHAEVTALFGGLSLVAPGVVSIPDPGHDEVVLTAPASAHPGNSRACAVAGVLAEVIVTYGVLANPATSPHDRVALWPAAAQRSQDMP